MDQRPSNNNCHSGQAVLRSKLNLEIKARKASWQPQLVTLGMSLWSSLKFHPQILHYLDFSVQLKYPFVQYTAKVMDTWPFIEY